MAATDVVSPSPVAMLNSRPILRDELKPAKTLTQKTFNPAEHLSHQHEPGVLTMSSIGLPGVGVSPVAVSQPFALFSEEAMQQMRSEIFTREVWEDCLFSTDFAGCQLRGHCPKYAPFMYDAWRHPRTIEIVSKIAGVDLVPVFDYEIGNINISVLDNEASKKKTADNDDGDVPVTKWHYDSYPFVCVVMMSDTSTMSGGETAVKTASGEVMKIRGPQIGCGVVLQGRYISHQALAAHGGGERITMITSFRPRDALVAHSSELTNIRPISDLSEMYFQWTKYRAEVVREQLDHLLRSLNDDYNAGKPTDRARVKSLLEAQADWLSGTGSEIHL